jgi:hypothetical protein
MESDFSQAKLSFELTAFSLKKASHDLFFLLEKQVYF